MPRCLGDNRHSVAVTHLTEDFAVGDPLAARRSGRQREDFHLSRARVDLGLNDLQSRFGLCLGDLQLEPLEYRGDVGGLLRGLFVLLPFPARDAHQHFALRHEDIGQRDPVVRKREFAHLIRVAGAA